MATVPTSGSPIRARPRWTRSPRRRGCTTRSPAAEARRVRLRGDTAVLGVPGAGTADVEWSVAALAQLDPRARGVTELLVLENKTPFLTVPTAPGRLVLWGARCGVDELLAALAAWSCPASPRSRSPD
jgi:hypothetical protein